MAKKNQYQAEFFSLNNFFNFLFCSFHCTAPTKTKRKTEKEKNKNNNRNIISNAARRKSCSVGATNLVVEAVVAEK